MGFMAALSIGSTVAGGLLNMGGKRREANARANEAIANAQQNEYLAKVARNNADYALWAGRARAERQDMKTGQQLGQIKAVQASSGFSVHSKTAEDVRDSAYNVAQLDKLTILHEADKSRRGFLTEAVLSDYKAANFMSAAEGYRTAGDYATAGSLIGTAGGVADKWLSFKRSGIEGF